FGTYEGLPRHLKDQLRRALEGGDTHTTAEPLTALNQELDRAHNPATKKVIGLLQAELQAWRPAPAPTPHDTAGSFPAPFPDPALLSEKLAMLDPSGQQIDDGLLELFPALEQVHQARTPTERIEAIL